ncbi:hypothetical protein OF83DRAFT_175565 [Amylostereum chailletii]|nr:hypothetical protein OF83DRAFT_175565 [Amylostereum chailletii]
MWFGSRYLSFLIIAYSLCKALPASSIAIYARVTTPTWSRRHPAAMPTISSACFSICILISRPLSPIAPQSGCLLLSTGTAVNFMRFAREYKY